VTVLIPGLQHVDGNLSNMRIFRTDRKYIDDDTPNDVGLLRETTQKPITHLFQRRLAAPQSNQLPDQLILLSA